MRWPDFLLIGAAKSGTTALFNFLKQHPDIYGCPVLEPNFFALEGSNQVFAGPGDGRTIERNSVRDKQAYQQLFSDASEAQCVGEVSPLYLYHEEAPARIKQYVPNMRLICVLRNPIDRAYASYLHLQRDGREPSHSFEEALVKESIRVDKGWEHLWHFRRMGCYATQLQRYVEHFDREQIKLFLYDDFQADPGAVVRACYAFLGVTTDFAPDMSRRFNPSGIPRSDYLQQMVSGQGTVKQILKRLTPTRLRGRIFSTIQRVNLTRPDMQAATRKELIDWYKDEINALADLIGRDLSHWLSD